MIKKILLFLGLFIVLLIFVYTVTNYNSFVIYTFNGNNNGLSISGNITLSNRINILNINNIKYEGIDKKVKRIEVNMYYYNRGNKKLMVGKVTEGKVSLKEYLEDLKIYHEEAYGYNEVFVDNMKYDFIKNAYIEIFYVEDKSNLERVINIKLDGKRYANNGIIYNSFENIKI